MGKVAKIHSVAPVGFDGKKIVVECDITNGLPSFQVVGLANKSIDEAKERVKSALTNSLLEYPAKHITINLAPAELPKNGTHYDLPIAIAILVSSGQLRHEDISNSLFAGELALDGSIRPVSGIISIAECAKKNGISTIFVPSENASQAALVKDIDIIPVKNLKELFLYLKKESTIPPFIADNIHDTTESAKVCIDDIVGQEQAKRALLIAAVGRHNLLLSGPPGAGKTMLGKALLGILPPLTDTERIEVTKLHSLAQETIDEIIYARPFRAPHHTSSRTSIIGGGNHPKPGEVSLAHLGVLFLDEIPEYPRATLESLRQPLEDKTVSITRANGRAQFPADFMLVATMNPCPCGYFGDTKKECSCSQTQILNYQNRLSGPMLDRIDMKLSVSRIPHETLLSQKSSTKAQHFEYKKLLKNANDFQNNRYKSSNRYNSSLSNSEIRTHCVLSDNAHALLLSAAEKLNLSARATFKTIKVARTIADIEQSERIEKQHIAEALQYR